MQNLNHERERVRSLARQVREIAEHSQQKTNIKLWTAVNDKKMIQPVVLVRDCPRFLLEEGTDELTLTVSDPLLRTVERDLLDRIYEWNHMRCHRVIEPVYYVDAVVHSTGFGFELPTENPGPVEDQRYTESKDYQTRITSFDDIEKIQTPVITYDEAKTLDNVAKVRDAIGDILEVKIAGMQGFDFALYDVLLSWTGIEEGMYNLALEPDFMHAAAARLVEAYVSMARQYEALGLISSNNRNLLIGNGGYGYTSHLPPPTVSGIGAKLSEIWGSAQDQIFTSVSPAMSQEFAFEEALPWTGLFDRVYYGCCERLDHKITELSETIPNLQKISVSPYSNLEAAMERIGDRFVVSFKPNSNYLAVDPWNKDLLKSELIEVCRLARKYNCHVEILMKTIINLAGNPRSLWEWSEMAVDIVENY